MLRLHIQDWMSDDQLNDTRLEDKNSEVQSTFVGEGTFDEVLKVVSELLVEIIGEDFLLDMEIGPDTSFNNDLELESIEFVALSEKLGDRFDHRVDFVQWIGGMELEEIIALSVGELVDYVVSCLQ